MGPEWDSEWTDQVIYSHTHAKTRLLAWLSVSIGAVGVCTTRIRSPGRISARSAARFSVVRQSLVVTARKDTGPSGRDLDLLRSWPTLANEKLRHSEPEGLPVPDLGPEYNTFRTVAYGTRQEFTQLERLGPKSCNLFALSC